MSYIDRKPNSVELNETITEQSLDETISFESEESFGDLSDSMSVLRLDHVEAAERYKLISLLGHGGMSLVHRVLDQRIGREVALKRIDPSKVSLGRLNFLIEAKVMSQLDHPGILPLYDFIEEEDESGARHFIGYTMRVATHDSLYEYLLKKGTVGVHEICNIIKQVALTLEHAHSRGVLHRDLKPHNILLGSEGEVYLTDWGICSLLPSHNEFETFQKLQRNALVGTPAYMAPEQTLCDASSLSPRTDVFGLGGTLYYALTGLAPFRGSELSVVIAKAQKAVIKAPDQVWEERGQSSPFPLALNEICLKALAYDPDQRYQSAREFAEALEHFSTGQLERERAHDRAKKAFELGQKSFNQFKELFAHGKKLNFEIDAAYQCYKESRTDEARTTLWTLQNELDDLISPQEETFSQATSSFQNALREDQDLTEAREAMTALYSMRYEHAVTTQDHAMMIFFEKRIREYATERFLLEFDRPSKVKFTGFPLGCRVIVHYSDLKRYQTLLRQKLYYSDYHGEEINLSRGNYLIEVTSDLGITLRVPLQLSRSRELLIHASIPKREALPQGFCYINNGLAMATHSTTIGEYYRFLNALPTDEADRHIPRYHQTQYARRAESGRFELPYTDAEGDTWQPEWPVVLVNYHDAVRYCEWLGQELGRKVRLPTLAEWILAATGGDGRPYPWGTDFDPSLCMMRESHSARPSPVPVGMAKSDCSPYGIRDLSGTCCQWTSTDVEGLEKHLYIVGAGWNSQEFLCHLDHHLQGDQDETLGHVGFRVVIELNEEDFLRST